MTSSKRTLGAALTLCILSACTFATAAASAASLTAVTCKEVGAGGAYSTSHCETPKGEGNFETTALSLNTPTEVEGTSTGEEPSLTAWASTGTAITTRCETSHLIGGSVKNEEPGGVMKISGTATRVTYTGCRLTLKANEARWCAIEEVTGPNPGTKGMISTTALKLETTGVEHRVKIQPQEGEVLVKFNVLPKSEGGNECPFTLKMADSLTGSIEGEVSTANHSHLTFTEANSGTELKVGSEAVKYVGTVGFSMSGTETAVGAQTFE